MLTPTFDLEPFSVFLFSIREGGLALEYEIYNKSL